MERIISGSVKEANSESLSKNSPEHLCHIELSLPQIRAFVDFCQEKGCRNEYGAYEVFTTDVAEEDKEREIDQAFLDELRIDGLRYFPDRSFEQIRYFAEEEKTDDEISPSIYGRLYISPSIENVPLITQKLIDQHQKNKKDLICKISRIGRRNDRIVIYLTDDFNEELSIIKQIQSDYPELFTNCGKNKMWCNIKGLDNVYFGSEPPNKAFSYGSDRARTIGDIFALQKEGLINIDKDKDLDEVFKLVCLRRGINPFNFGFYIEDDTVRSSANDVLYGYFDEEYKQEEEYLEAKTIVEKWLRENANSSQQSWLGEDVPPFGSGSTN